MIKSSLNLSALIASTALLAACSGGGGGSSAPSTPVPPTGGTPSNPSPPTNDAVQYKDYLQASLKLILGVEDIAKTLYQFPAKIKADVEANPFTRTLCDSSCQGEDTSQWKTFPVSGGGDVRLEDWRDRSQASFTTADGILNEYDSLRLDLRGISTPSGAKITTSSYINANTLPYPYSFGLTANYELTRKGLTINGKTSPEFRGSLTAKIVDGRYQMSDTLDGAEVNRDLIIDEKNNAGSLINSWMVAFKSSSNANDRDQVTFDMDMLNYNGGATLKLKSVESLNFGNVTGGDKLQIESGSFTYEYQDGARNMNFVLRVSVDADPAYLYVEIDDGADGSYEKSGRLPQSDFDYTF